MNPRILGIRLDMLVYLYRRRVRAHPLAELLAGAGVAVGVALVFGVLLANTSLTSSASRLIHGLAGSARYELVARSSAGVSEAVVWRAGELDGVQVAAPVLRETVTLRGPRGEQPVQLIGLTPSLEALGGMATQELGAGALLLKGGLGLPSGVADALGVGPSGRLEVAAAGLVQETRVRVILGNSPAGVSASPVAVSVLMVAQRLSHRPGRVSEILVRPVAGSERIARAGLTELARSEHLDLRSADSEVRLLGLATRPSRQSTSLFTAIAVMIGFLLALNAVLLTVPERRRFIAELRMQGYDLAQVALLMGLQALVLGLGASLVGLGLGDVLSRVFFRHVPGFLTAAFPIGAEEVVRPSTMIAAVGCGLLATALASLAPLTDLRSGRATNMSLHHVRVHSETVRERTVGRLVLLSMLLAGASSALALLAPSFTIVSGVVLALVGVCLIPAGFWVLARLLPWAARSIRSSALIVTLVEMRSTTTRTAALAAIVALAVYGGVAIGGARKDLLRGIDEATAQYFGTAQVWVTSGRDVFNVNSFDPSPSTAALARLPEIASVRVYRGGLLDVGDRRMWVRARPAGDAAVLESSQLMRGDYATATRLIDGGAPVSDDVDGPRSAMLGAHDARGDVWAAVSNDFADEHRLHVGGRFSLPTPSGDTPVRVAAITTNSGWPAGAITLGGGDYARLWRARAAAALEVSLRAGVTPQAGRRAVMAALGPGSGLQVSTAAERIAQSAASARQGLRTLAEISTLLLIAAALSVASALSAAIWQRRMRLAALKIQGYDAGQLWRAVLVECAATISIGALVGAGVGVAGHALASRFLALTTGFPAPFSAGPAQVLLTVALFAAIALAVIALPGAVAVRIPPRAVLQE